MATKRKDVKDLVKAWNRGKDWIDKYTEEFPEIDNLVDGVSNTNTPKAPRVGSVTLGSAVRQIPRASIQQVPTFSVEVNGTKNSITALVCDYLVRRVVFNQDTFGKGVLSTMQISAETALAHGFQPLMASLGTSLNDFGTMMKMIHYNDIVIEPGVFDSNESAYFQIRTRVTKHRIRKLIKAAEKNPETTWNVKALKDLLKSGPNTDFYHQMMSDPRAQFSPAEDVYDFITDYRNEPFGEITVFCPSIEEPLRVTRSKSKFGYPRATFLVLDPAQQTPFGVSRVRLASPTANYANIYLQSTAKMLLLNSDPPIFQRGQFTTPVRLRRGALWQALDPNSEVKLQELSNSNLQQFLPVLDFLDKQTYAILGVTPGAVGAQDAGGAYKNTVVSNMEKNVSDLSNTQITNILENTLRQYALTGLDLYVSEQVGEEDLIVDDQCKNAINRFAEAKHMETAQPDPMTGMPPPFVPVVGDDNIVKINWEQFYESIKTWTIDIELSMTKDTIDEKKRADIQDMLTVMSQNADPADVEKQQRIRELEDTLLEKTVPETQRLGQRDQAPMGMPAGGEQAPPM